MNENGNTQNKFSEWLKNNSLWFVGFGLMLASSGLDGTYMAQWMQKDLWFLGYILNTVSDVASTILIYWYGIFQQSNNAKKREMSKILLYTDIVSIVYSWFFSWRQLRFVMPQIEMNPLTGMHWEVEAVSFLSAGFIPLTLAFVGYAQSIRERKDVQITPGKSNKLLCWCGKELKNERAYRSHLRFHRNEVSEFNSAKDALLALQKKYADTIKNASFEFPSVQEVKEWMK